MLAKRWKKKTEQNVRNNNKTMWILCAQNGHQWNWIFDNYDGIANIHCDTETHTLCPAILLLLRIVCLRKQSRESCTTTWPNNVKLKFIARSEKCVLHSWIFGWGQVKSACVSKRASEQGSSQSGYKVSHLREWQNEEHCDYTSHRLNLSLWRSVCLTVLFNSA